MYIHNAKMSAKHEGKSSASLFFFFFYQQSHINFDTCTR